MVGDFCEGSKYYGGRLLSFAVVHSSFEIVDFLLAQKAPLDGTDRKGNSALHMCVRHDRPKTLKHLQDIASSIDGKLDSLLLQVNEELLTPLTYAVVHDKPDIFRQLLDMQGKLLWIYGPVSCMQYPLRELESLYRGPSRDRSHSVLHLIAKFGNTETIGSHPVVAQVWPGFAGFSHRLLHFRECR